jgi:hypothetical protein
MIEDEEGKLGEDWADRHRDVVQRHWKGFVELLRSSGYGALCKLRVNLKARREELQEAIEKGRQEVKYASRIIDTFCRCALEGSEEIAERPNKPGRIPPDMVERALDARVFDTVFRSHGVLLPKYAGHGWHSMFSGTAWEGEQVRARLQLSYHPHEDKLEEWGIDSDSRVKLWAGFHPIMYKDTTWNEAIEKIREAVQVPQRHYHRKKQTDDLLKFRLDVLENVLYRFEAFGEVEELTGEEASEMISDKANAFEDLPTTEAYNLGRDVDTAKRRFEIRRLCRKVDGWPASTAQIPATPSEDSPISKRELAQRFYKSEDTIRKDIEHVRKLDAES